MMRAVALIVVGAVATGFAQATPASTPGGVIRGKVTASDSGQPIADAEIRVTGGTFTTLEPLWAYTGADGTYEIGGLPAGRYRVSADRIGYLRLEHGQQRPAEPGTDVVVVAATVTERIDFSLPRGAVIIARVVDEFGDPVPGYMVRVFERRAGNPALVPAAAGLAGMSSFFRGTDDRGEMRVWGLAPGSYYVAANVSPGLSAQTFFPGTTEAEARPVVVGLGEEVFIEFPLVRARASRISGAIVGTPPFSAWLSRRDAGISTDYRISVLPDGRFTATGLAPAEYVISARAGSQAAMLRVRVSGEDIDGLTVTVKDTVTLRGRVLFDPKAPSRSQWPSTMWIRPIFAEGGGVSSLPVLNQDWSFEIPGVMGTGVLRFSELPPGWFLKAVTVEGRDVTDVPVDFAALDGRPIEIQLTQQLARLSGVVLDENDKPTRAYSVVIFPDDSALWTPYSRSIAVARPDQNGRFVADGLPAGRYLIRAVASLQSDAERNRDTLDRLRAGATALTLKDREAADVTLRLRP